MNVRGLFLENLYRKSLLENIYCSSFFATRRMMVVN